MNPANRQQRMEEAGRVKGREDVVRKFFLSLFSDWFFWLPILWANISYLRDYFKQMGFLAWS